MVLLKLLSLRQARICFWVIKIWKILTWLKVDLMLTILNLMCECASAALEQVAGNRLVYVASGFGCAMVSIGFAGGELLWMKKKNRNTGMVDRLGFIGALVQVLSSGIHVILVRLHISSPIIFSLFSLIYPLAFAYYKIIQKSSTREFVIHCKKHVHYSQPFKVCEEIHPTKTLFECPFCANLEPVSFNSASHLAGESSHQQEDAEFEESIDVEKEH